MSFIRFEEGTGSVVEHAEIQGSQILPENHKIKEFLSKTGSDPLKSSQHSILGHPQPGGKTPFASGPMMACL